MRWQQQQHRRFLAAKNNAKNSTKPQPSTNENKWIVYVSFFSMNGSEYNEWFFFAASPPISAHSHPIKTYLASSLYSNLIHSYLFNLCNFCSLPNRFCGLFMTERWKLQTQIVCHAHTHGCMDFSALIVISVFVLHSRPGQSTQWGKRISIH